MKFKIICTTVILLLASTAGCTSASPPGFTSLPAQSSSPVPTQEIPLKAEWLPDGVINAGEYLGSNKYGEYMIYWRSDEQFIYIGLMAKTNGWVSMALQPGSRMKDSDMVLGFVKDGNAEVIDLFCTDNFGAHPEDTELGGSNDIISSGGIEEGGFTIVEFKRSLITGDKYDIEIQKGINKILWAYGFNDSPGSKHTSRGYGEINLE